MKKYIISSLLISIISFQAYAQKEQKPSTKALDEKFGFRDILLESDISLHPELIELKDEKVDSPDQKYYKRTSDELKVGGASLKSITYVYYKGKLEMVMLAAEGFANSAALLEAYQAQYGHGYHYYSYSPYSWDGKRCSLILSKNSISGDGTSLLSSTALRKQEEADSKSKAKAAKGDL